MRRRQLLFAAIPSSICAGVFAAVYYALDLGKSAEEQGKELNQLAWEASFRERGLSVPRSGPRDDWHSLRLIPKKAHPTLEWTEDQRFIPGFLDVDSSGLQHWRSTAAPKRRVLIVGASVAFGIYASRIDATYFAVAGRDLEQHGLPVTIDVFAAGAWKAMHELEAIKQYLSTVVPDLVVVIDGVNDLCLGATPDHTFYSPTNAQYQTPDRPFADDYEVRKRKYLSNLQAMIDFCEAMGSKILLTLQPGIFESQKSSSLERKILEATFAANIPPATIVETYRSCFAEYRTSIGAMAKRPSVFFFDASREFAAENTTTFSDFWHFADPGQEIFGKALATEINKALVGG